MSTLINAASFLILVGLGVVALGIQVMALSDCLRTPTSDFQRVYKRTKLFWGALTGASAFFGFIFLIGPVTSSLAYGMLIPPGIGFNLLLNLAAVTAASVYLADVRPALAEVRGRGKGNQNRGSSW
ncbi:DUF2516 family protein [Arthrobacter sp. GMC3]|uniref:DUF2516 family protein n=1 Tax=Arthrobacter sp. GMC3 TaxID=2058894 RepID=UPI000CE495D7|nr:DUF2516 family protein [Arthrobacter sp. GMC3]